MVWTNVITIAKTRERNRRSYQKHRTERILKVKIWRSNNKELVKLYQKRWNKKNPLKLKSYKYRYLRNNHNKVLNYRRDYLKKINHKFDKIPLRKNYHSIIATTQYYFPLELKTCEHCGKKAEVHHHTTKPIVFDKFKYLCKKCHYDIHQIGSRIGYSQEENVNK